MKRSTILLILIPLIAFLLMMSIGCGSNANNPTVSNQSPIASQPTSQARQETPSESLNKTISKVTTMSFTLSAHNGADCLAPLSQPSNSGSYNGCFNTTFTQKGNNIRIDGIADDGRPAYAIYNYSKKQIAYVSLFSKGMNPNNGFETEYEYGTTGWRKADTVLEHQQNVILNLLNHYLPGFPGNALNVKKEGNTYLFTMSGNNNTYILECAGPEGLPTKLIQEVPAYGANPKIDTALIDLTYTKVNQITDSMFELDSNLKITEASNGEVITLGGTFGVNNSSSSPGYLDGHVAQ